MAQWKKPRQRPPSPERPPARSRVGWRWLRTALALIVIGTAYFYHLDRPPLWADEADTGIFARNTLTHGVPSASDGRNVDVYENGAQLNRGLLSKKIPWLQYYVGALSLKLFGNDTKGLRLLFAVAGLLAFFPIEAVLRPRSRYADVLTTLALISPQVVLFQRNARYYSLLILLYAVLVWHLSTECRTPRRRFVSAAAILIVLFHTHPFAAGCCAASLVLYCFFVRREALVLYAGACAVGLSSWLVWYVWLGPSLSPMGLFAEVARTTLGGWFGFFLTGLQANGIDFDVIDCFPALLCAAIAAMLYFQGRSTARQWMTDPLPTFVLLNVLVQAALTSALLEPETGHAFLRYFPHLIVFGLLAGFVLLRAVMTNPALHVAVCAAVVSLNVFTLSFWVQPSGRFVPISWMREVYSEIFWPQDSAWEEIIHTLRTQSPGVHGPKTLLVGVPAWTQEILMFYVGDRYLIKPLFNVPPEDIEEVLRNVVGAEATSRFDGEPEWIVDSLSVLQSVPSGYAAVVNIPSHRVRPDDGARPELTRHAFAGSAAVRTVRVFHAQNGPGP